MNNLFIILIAGAAGLALFSEGQRNIADTESSVALLRNRAAVAKNTAKASQTEMRQLEKLFVSEQQSIQKLRSTLDIETPQEPAETDLANLTPQKEGFWPADKPYFYVSKSRLQGMTYWLFDDDRLSKTTATLFGMTPEEERAANAAFANMQAQLHEIEIAHAVTTNAPAWVATWPGDKQSLYIQPVSRETIDALDQEFKANLAQAIGPERGAILARRIDEETDHNAYGLTKGRTFTLIRQGDSVQLAESYGSGNTRNSSEQSSDGHDVIPLRVRHLFQ